MLNVVLNDGWTQRRAGRRAAAGEGTLYGIEALERRLLLSAAGQLFVVNNGSLSIEEYTTAGAAVNKHLVGSLYDPNGIALSGSDLFESNYSAGTIGEYTTAGTTVNAALVSGLSDPEGIAISGSDLFVANFLSGTIGEYTTSGATVNAALVTGLTQPTGIVISGSNLFVSNASGTIGEYTISGVTVNPALVTGLHQPSGLAISGSDLFVANYASGTIGEYTTSGATVNAALVKRLGHPFGIAVAGSDLFVANDQNGRIGEYTTGGATVNAALVSGLSEAIGLAVQIPTPPSTTPITYLTDFPKDNNIYTNLNVQFPHTGTGVPGSTIGTPNASYLFDPSSAAVGAAGYAPNYINGSNLANNGIDFLLTSDGSGKDFEQINGGPGITVAANVADVHTVYALMGAYDGQKFNVTLTGANGAAQSFSGIFVPDFNGGGPVDSASSNPAEQTVFQVHDVGAGGSGNSTTGATNTYDLTEVAFVLEPSLADQVLSKISFTSDGFDTLLLGVTASMHGPPPGSIDPTFNNGNPVNVGFATQSSVQTANGQVLLAGLEPGSSAGSTQAVLERLNSDGSIDSGFGTAGIVTDSATPDEVYYGVVSESDGTIVAAGTSGGDLLLAGYNANGSVDASFGSGGRVVVPISGTSDATAFGITLDASGNLDVVGSGGGQFLADRFSAAGVQEPSFNGGSPLLFGTAANGDVLGKADVQSNGDIVAAGASSANVVVVRLTAAGAWMVPSALAGSSPWASWPPRTCCRGSRTIPKV